MMAYTEVSLANMALTKLGEELITNLDDNVKQAQYIKAIFSIKMNELLTKYDWHFNRKITTLAYTTNTPDDYLYEYTLPNDFLKVISINGSYNEDFKIRGNYLYSDSDEIELEYLASLTDYTFLPSMIAEAFACLLASELAITLTGNKENKQLYLQEYEYKAREAYFLEIEQYQEDDVSMDDDDWITAGRG